MVIQKARLACFLYHHDTWWYKLSRIFA